MNGLLAGIAIGLTLAGLAGAYWRPYLTTQPAGDDTLRTVIDALRSRLEQTELHLSDVTGLAAEADTLGAYGEPPINRAAARTINDALTFQRTARPFDKAVSAALAPGADELAVAWVSEVAR